MKPLAKLSALFVLLLITCLPKSGTAAPIAAEIPKSFAVFTASYNLQGDLVRGGVCGTVFFVSATKAITAFHVLKPQSFHPLAGFERVRVWLVHEDYRAVEMKPEFLTYNPGKDITVIQLPHAQSVDKKFIFEMAKLENREQQVFTDGFIANTDGPHLARQGQDVTILDVPKLERLHLEGSVVRRAKVNLKAADIDLKSSPSIQLSYKPVVGISGGPVVANGKVIAMNSFADPGSFQQTWALQLLPSIPTFARP